MGNPSYGTILRIATLIFILIAILSRTSGTTVPLEPENHGNPSLHRSFWPSWFHHRQESSSTSLNNKNRDEDESIVKNNHFHGRHESKRISRPSATSHKIHSALKKNSGSRDDVKNAGEHRRRYSDDRFVDRTIWNDSPVSIAIDKSSMDHRGPNGIREPEFSDSLTARTAETTSTTRTTRSQDLNQDNDDGKSEKLTAVAVAEYSGTRAVAYAGYNRRNLDYKPTRTREDLTPGYGIVATVATPSYTKHHSGRRVCSRQAPSSIAHHHHSGQYRLVYTELSSSTFLCCPGWSQVSRTSYGCNRPTCAAPCLNGGVCGPHGKCNCPKGFMGTQCQTDVDECVTEKPCGQLCRNLPGSYECHCRYGFQLQPDGQSCRKNGSDGTAFEARDLENDYGYTTIATTEITRRTTPVSHGFEDTENEVGEGNLDQDYEIILKRLAKLEKQIARGKKRETETSDITTKINQAVEGVAAMRRAVDNVQLMQQEIYDMRGKVKQFELESRKLQYLTNRVAELENRLRIRCRNIING